jgi:hypothetical protein
MYKVFGTNTKKMLNMLILEILEAAGDIAAFEIRVWCRAV